MSDHSSTSQRRLHLERLEDRRMLANASFVDVAQTHGLSGLVGGSGEFHAGGLVFTDLNSDGYADLYLIGRVGIGNRLYINIDDGAGGRTFQRAAGDGGAAYALGRSTGAIAADYDNDGDLDIYLTNYQDENILFRNMWLEDHPAGVGDPLALRFVDATSGTDPTPTNPSGDNQHGLGYATFVNPDPLFTTTVLDNTMAAAWADVNRDGWVDLYVGSWDGTNGNPAESDDGRLGERDTLYLNNGDGTFTDITMALDGSVPAEPVQLLADSDFEATTSGSQFSADWTVIAPNSTVQFQEAGWASSSGLKGVWFKGFAGNEVNPIDASVSQVVTAPADGDYTLQFDAKVEQNFATVAGAFRVTITSDGTGGTVSSGDLLSLAPDFGFNTYSLTLSGVTAGDQLTVVAEMLDTTGGTGPQLSGMVDNFRLLQAEAENAWQQVGGWEYSNGTYNDTGLPAEFSGHNALQFADFNNDGWQDLIVATMGGGSVGPNRDMLYINRGNDAQGNWLGYRMVSYEIGFGGEESSDMGVAVADIDNDGDLDYFSTLLPAAHPIWINNFVETGELSFTRTTINNDFAWGANFHDFDNNGRVDLMVGTEVDRRSFLHLQDLNGNFDEQGIAAGLTTTHTVRGLAVADYNRDGWSDAAHWSWLGANPGIQLFENRSAPLNTGLHFLTIELEGDPTLPGAMRSTRDAIGARVYVSADFDGDGSVAADETRMEEVLSGHSNASTTSSLALEFGLGQATNADVRVVWGSGRETQLLDVAADQFLSIQETAGSGDFNDDGDVDGADFLAWQTGGDADGDSDSDADDLAIWDGQYGSGTTNAAAFGQIEPDGLPMIVLHEDSGIAEHATEQPDAVFIATSPSFAAVAAIPSDATSLEELATADAVDAAIAEVGDRDFEYGFDSSWDLWA